MTAAFGRTTADAQNGVEAMTECIDKEDYCKNRCHSHNEHCDKESCPICTVPAADVVEVTRCKDCKYSKKLFSYEGSYSSYCLICGSKGSVVFPNDFCSCGERQTNGLK